MNRNLWIGVGALALCGICGLIYKGSGKDKAPSADATATPVLVATEAAPTTAASNEGAEYAAWMRQQLASLQEPTTNMQTLFQEMSANPSVVLTDEWKIKMAGGLASLRVTAGAMRDRPAPPGNIDAKALALTIADHLEEGSTLTARAIDKIDADMLKEGMAEFSKIAPLMADLDKELSKLEQ